MDIESALTALEALASTPSTSASGPLDILLDPLFNQARDRLTSGDDPKTVITDLQKSVVKAKKEVEKGLKAWYGALGNVGKAVEKTFPPNLAAISLAYDDPPLFSEGEAPVALDKVVMASLGRQGLWDAVEALEEETGLKYDQDKRGLSEVLYRITDDIERGDVSSALRWCEENSHYLQSPPHPSPLPYHLHRSLFLRMEDRQAAIRYAREHLMEYVPTQPVLALLTSSLYPQSSPAASQLVTSNGGTTNGTSTTSIGHEDAMDIDGIGGKEVTKRNSPYTHDTAPLVHMFRAEFCRRHEWPKEDPLEVVVDLGSRGGALNAIEKARRVMGDRLGRVRTWTDLPMEIPLPPSRRYHSVFVCPVSKEQATESNPPKMLSCGHVIAAESFSRMLKGGRRAAKCPYCPQETSIQVAQRLYF